MSTGRVIKNESSNVNAAKELAPVPSSGKSASLKRGDDISKTVSIFAYTRLLVEQCVDRAIMACLVADSVGATPNIEEKKREVRRTRILARMQYPFFAAFCCACNAN